LVIRSSPMPSATTRALRPAIHITGESSRGVKAHNLATKTKDGQQSHTVSQMVPKREIVQAGLRRELLGAGNHRNTMMAATRNNIAASRNVAVCR